MNKIFNTRKAQQQEVQHMTGGRWRPVVLASPLALSLVTMASAQTGDTGVGALPIAAWITSISGAVSTAMTNAGAPLFLLLGLIGAFFFVWNRVRSLW